MKNCVNQYNDLCVCFGIFIFVRERCGQWKTSFGVEIMRRSKTTLCILNHQGQHFDSVPF